MAISLGPVKDYVKGYADQIASMFGITNAGGWRASDPYPDHPSGHAVDFMVNNLGAGGDARTNPVALKTGDELSAYIMANAAAMNVKYIIWNGRSWNPKRGTWVKYTGSSNMHYDHVHVTWNDQAGPISQLPGAGATITPVGLTSSINDKLTQVLGAAEGTLTTLAVAGLGLSLVAAGLWLAVSPKVRGAVNSLPGIPKV